DDADDELPSLNGLEIGGELDDEPESLEVIAFSLHGGSEEAIAKAPLVESRPPEELDVIDFDLDLEEDEPESVASPPPAKPAMARLDDDAAVLEFSVDLAAHDRQD
ncbi:MAG: hypothetical protein HQL93_13610, partial [Magnetococcales bacterium]|nr:hypothetical protein [Magnetococcales bacterium]